MECIFVSDLHGKKTQYQKLFKIIKKETPDGVFLGGDILPNHLKIDTDMDEFIENIIFYNIRKIKKNEKIKFFVILGNDDPKIFEKIFLEADGDGLINYVHNKTVEFEDLFVTGYSYVPPTPFQLKDWEKYDVSQFLDVGAISPENGIRTVEVSNDEKRYGTIAEDLELLHRNVPLEKTIFLFHAPPYNSYLDRAELDGKIIDHAPINVHIGSIAIQRFIQNKQPFLTLHGHVHESQRLTGHWREKFGKTYSFNASYDGSELAVIRFSTDDLKNATKDLISIA